MTSTILVVDEYGEGFPVAWCLSNRTDEALLISYFQSIKVLVGNIIPKWFMSDDAEQFYTAWISVFGPGPHKLLCSWHVDRAWRKNIKLIESKETQAEVYHMVARFLSKEQKMNSKERPASSVCKTSDTDVILHEVQQQNILSSAEHIKEKLQKKLSMITAQLHLCTNIEALESTDTHLNSILGIMKVFENGTSLTEGMVHKHNGPANKHIIKQRPFFSTKRKRKLAAIRLAKPTISEKEMICRELETVSMHSNSFYSTLYKGKRLHNIKGTYKRMHPTIHQITITCMLIIFRIT